MSQRKTLYVVLSLLFVQVGTSFVVGQERGATIIKIREHDQDGKQTEVAEDTIIVDINSELVIALDKSNIRKKLQAFTDTTLPRDLQQRISIIQKALAQRERSLKFLQEALELWQKAQTTKQLETFQAFEGKLDQATAGVGELLDLAGPGSLLLHDYNNLLEAVSDAELGNPLIQYKLFYQAAAKELERLNETFDIMQKEKGVFVQVGAWIVNENTPRPIHLEDFDDYPEGEYFEVKRWNLILSEEQQKQLDALSTYAQALNNNKSDFSKTLKTMVTQMLKNILFESNTYKCLTTLKDSVVALSKLDVNSSELTATIRGVKEDVESFLQSIDALIAKYESGGAAAQLSQTALLAETNRDIASLLEKAENLMRKLSDSEQKLRSLLNSLSKTIRERVDSCITRANECVNAAKADVGEWKKRLKNQLDQVLFGDQFDDAALQLGEKVRKLDIKNIPEKTTIRLTQTGSRENGDVVILKVSGGGSDSRRQELEVRRVYLYQVLTHAGIVTGLIFAHHQFTAKPDGAFQAAPSYSILFKGFLDSKKRRSSVVYNRFVDPGIGINVSALDFDHDNTPEIGVGLVFSLLADYAQIGYGINVHANKGYFFFGLRFPVPSLDIQ